MTPHTLLPINLWKVVHTSAEAPAVLRVVNPHVPPRFGSGATETYLLPFVPDVLPQARPAECILLATPPSGLLRLGRRRLLIEYLRPRLMVSKRSGGLCGT